MIALGGLSTRGAEHGGCSSARIEGLRRSMIASTGLRPRLARQGLYHALATGLPVAVNRPGASRLTRAVATIGLGVAALGTGQTLHAQVPVGVHRTTGQPPWSLALTPAPPVTVADLIEMTTLGSQLQGDGHAVMNCSGARSPTRF
jgi:hypothetical protein